MREIYRRKNSYRLKRYDYSDPGAYFVTMVTKNRVHVFGDVVDGVMKLSETGKIAESYWREIPMHFPNTNVEVFQIMPNHIHGIVEIRNALRIHAQPVRVEYIQPERGPRRGGEPHLPARFQHVTPNSLSSIIRSFKGAVTREINRSTYSVRVDQDQPLWLRSFHDHIIRDDVSYYYIERYINLNPLLWHLDSDNPEIHETPIDNLRWLLKERHNLDDNGLEYLINHEIEYRQWRILEMKKEAAFLLQTM